MIIRPVQQADSKEWLRMRMALWPESTPEKELGEIVHFFGSPPLPPLPELLVAFVAVRPDGGLCGLAEGSIHSSAPGCSADRIGFLEAWYVDPDCRGLGLGARLANAIEDWARSEGCREMASDTNPSYPLSPGAHAALGYAEVAHSVEGDIYFWKDL